ncbi:hypothetical protein CO661_01305 [Sinorhizobium fredii]|uniref:Uncharacterized protein n=1 Tax=Rhizobium fredii TaxID=380 RepID=A0A2A6M7F5_RHIFR|nr:hypothetical protein CO661_01305 [Sinorhizobium fredii]
MSFLLSTPIVTARGRRELTRRCDMANFSSTSESYHVDGRILKFLVQGFHYARELALLSCGT